MAKLEHRAKVIRGRIVYAEPTTAHKAISLLENKRIAVSIEELKNSRSSQQNRYYWGVVVPLVTEGLINAGYQVSSAQAHEFIKSEFTNQEIINTQTGEIKNIPGSTTTLNTKEFCLLIERIQIWGAEWLNIIIPDPALELE